MPESSTRVPARRQDVPATTKGGKAKTIKHTVLGEEFTLYTKPNAFLTLAMSSDPDDTANMYRFVMSLVHEADRRRFGGLLGAQNDFGAEDLVKIFNEMLEAVAAGNPTPTSSGSRRSARSTGGRKLSAAS